MDLKCDIKVDKGTGTQKAEELKIPYFETSATSHKTLEPVYQHIIEYLIKTK